jgi:hypothetical protein
MKTGKYDGGISQKNENPSGKIRRHSREDT